MQTHYIDAMIKLLRKFAALLALLLAATVPAAAAPAPSELAQPGQLVNPALWKVEGPNATIYLFGTIHLLPADVHVLDGRVAEAFGQSTTLVTEILDPAPGELEQIIAAKAMLPQGQNLRDMLAPPDRRRFEAALLANHLPDSAFDRYQPWYAAVALATMPMLKLGYDPENGVDKQLGRRAQTMGLPHEGLETAAYQLGLFAGLPEPMQKTYLMQVVRELPQVKSQLTGIIEAWEAGNARRLAKLINDDNDEPQMMQVLLIDRNKTWAKWIKARLARRAGPHETIFLAVGAGHLAGAGSVMDQLQALGIASERLQ